MPSKKTEWQDTIPYFLAAEDDQSGSQQGSQATREDQQEYEESVFRLTVHVNNFTGGPSL